jgi:hypothetical protein
MGLGCAALTGNPNFPTFPNPLSTEQTNAGLSAPATAITLLGKGGAVLMLILLFMAVTSSTSAELIAVSSLLTFDVYKTYYRPGTSSEVLVKVSHWAIALYAIVLAAFCCILNAAGISLTWLLTVLGVIVGGAALPVGMILLWKPMSTVAAVGAPWIGFLCGLVVWFVTTWKRSGVIDVATTGDVTNALAGNLASFGVGFIMAVALTFAFPKKHASPKMTSLAGIPAETTSHEETTKASEAKEQVSTSNTADELAIPASARNELVDYLESNNTEPMDPVLAKRGERIAWAANGIFIFGAVILVPFTLFGTGYIYSKSFFTGWVVVSFIWVWASVMICVVYPVVSGVPTPTPETQCERNRELTIGRSKVWEHCEASREGCGRISRRLGGSRGWRMSEANVQSRSHDLCQSCISPFGRHPPRLIPRCILLPGLSGWTPRP